MARTVSAIFTNVQPVNYITWQGIAIGTLRDVVVERRVRHDYAADARKKLAAHLDDVRFSIVVKRRELGDITHPLDRFVSDDFGLGEVPTSLHDAVPDAVDGLVDALQDLIDMLHGRLVIRKGDLELLLLAAKLFMADEGAVDTNPLTVTLCKDFTRIHVEQLIL